MAGVSVNFRATDEISSRFDAMVNAGSKALDTLDQLESAANSSYDAMVDGANEAAQAMDRAASATSHWTDKIGNYDKEAMQAVWSTEELVEMGYMTEDALNQAVESAEDAAKAVGEYGDKSEEAAKKSEKFGEESTNAIVSLGDVLAAAGIAVAIKEIASAFIEASDAAAEFETSVAKLTTVADTAILSADELAAQINDVSMSTAQNVNDLADSAYNAISAGVDTANALDTVTTATELAVAGFTSTESALSVLTTAMNAYHLEASDLANVSDSLIMSQNLGVMTIDQLSSSMGKAIATASAYSVDLYNLEAAYIATTKGGISVEESTTYLASMFKELGTAGSDIADILQEETGKSFGQLMQDGYNLADVLDILYRSVQGDTEALMNLWGSAEAGKAANAVISQGLDNFSASLDKVKFSAGTTATAYETMTNTTEYASKRLENSAHNLQIAFGEDINPVAASLKNGFADLLDGATKLVQEHPAIAAVLTGAAVGIGAVTVAITAYIAVTKVAAIASTALGASITAALGPISLIVAAIGAVTAAVIYFSNTEDQAAKAQEHFTSSSQAMADELDELQAQYDALAESQEADSVAAYQLKNRIDELTYALENNGRTIGDLIHDAEELGNRLDDMNQSYEDTMNSIATGESDSKSLIAQLAAMEQNSNLTGSQLEIMSNIVDRLNDSYAGLNLTMDETNGKLNMSIEDLWSVVSDAAEQEKAEANMQRLVDYLAQYQEAQAQYDEATRTRSDAWSEYEYARDELFPEEHPILASTGWAEGAEMNWSGSAKDAYNVWKQADEAVESTKANFEEVDAVIRECYENMGYTAEEIDNVMAELALASAEATAMAENLETAADQANEVSDGYEEATTILEEYRGEIEQLCAAYDEAYEAAIESISGQYSLWEEADTVVAMTNSSIQNALQSQIDYWTNYSENLDILTAKAADIEGLGAVLEQLASDGSADAAAMIAGMASMNDTDLSAIVQQYANLQEAQGQAAGSVADLETSFSQKMDDMTSEMEDMVGSMNMSDEAAANAKSTIDAYVGEIETGIARAQRAIDSLNFSKATLSGGGFHEYATGTLNAAPGLALVGEEGPELVNFGGGEVVYTAPETAEILSRDVGSNSLFVPPEEEATVEGGRGDKTITLKIEGAGEMTVGGGSGVSKEDVVGILVENMKGTLMNIIQQEILEEGEMAYEF